jgi:hypothetical protein
LSLYSAFPGRERSTPRAGQFNNSLGFIGARAPQKRFLSLIFYSSIKKGK